MHEMSTEESANPPEPVPDDERLYGIAQVSRILGVKPFVLRYWESEFPMLEPVKGKTGHRLYREQDVALVKKIKTLLYDEGFTIAGARRHLQELAEGTSGNGTSPDSPHSEAAPEIVAASPIEAPVESNHGVQLDRAVLIELRDALRGFLTLLERK
jgi:DNA-binding transcriptional MerR regulator